MIIIIIIFRSAYLICVTVDGIGLKKNLPNPSADIS